MARFEAVKCDRCNRIDESRNAKAMNIDGKSKDLCPGCQKKLTRFLGGEELASDSYDIPP